MAERDYVMLTIKAADANELASIEERLSAALSDATLEATHRFVTDLGQIDAETQIPALHQCHLMVRIPGMSGAEARARLEDLAPDLGVRVAQVLTRPEEPGEFVSYHGKGILGPGDLDEDFELP
jgi:hypothetical protein